METESPVITVPPAGDPRFGYLNNENVRYPFSIEGKIWKSVEHFLLAKPFEGTVLEDQIRRAKNLVAARLLSKRRKILVEEDGRVYHQYVYGPDKTCYKNETWNRKTYLKQAIEAKFVQNKIILAKLLTTEGMKISYEKDPLTGNTIERFRDKYIRKTRKNATKVAKRIFAAPYADLNTGELVDNEILVVKKYIKGVNILYDLENIDSREQPNVEMLEDVFYNFFPTKKLVPELLALFKQWTDTMFSKWSEMTKIMPNFESVLKEIEEMLVKELVKEFIRPAGKPIGAKTKINLSMFIAVTIRWLRKDATEDERKIFYDPRDNFTEESFLFPPIKREYRNFKHNLSRISKRRERKTNSKGGDGKIEKPREFVPDDVKTAKRGALYIKLFGKVDPNLFSKITTKLELMKKVDRRSFIKKYREADDKTREILLNEIL